VAREPIPTWGFALVVARLGRRILLVHERKHGQGWYLPAGRVEPGETFPVAARRETLEETGVPVTLEGVLRVEHTPSRDGTARLRVFYLARPTDDTPPRGTPNEHSLEARWVALEELQDLSLRGEEVRELLLHVLHGGVAWPLTVLTPEGAPWDTPQG
jgi:phosphatase NudJ